VLLIKVEIDTDGFQILDGAQEIDERAADTVYGPGHDHIELPVRWRPSAWRRGTVGPCPSHH